MYFFSPSGSRRRFDGVEKYAGEVGMWDSSERGDEASGNAYSWTRLLGDRMGIMTENLALLGEEIGVGSCFFLGMLPVDLDLFSFGMLGFSFSLSSRPRLPILLRDFSVQGG